MKNDADTIREETATLIHDAQTMQEEGELRRHKSHPLSREISSTETRSDEYEKKIQGQAETMRKLSIILVRVKSRMSRCPPLERFKEARKRLVRVTSAHVTFKLFHLMQMGLGEVKLVENLKDEREIGL